MATPKAHTEVLNYVSLVLMVVGLYKVCYQRKVDTVDLYVTFFN